MWWLYTESDCNTYTSGSMQRGLWRWTDGWLEEGKNIQLTKREIKKRLLIGRYEAYIHDWKETTNSSAYHRSVRHVHHPSLWLWCQLQQNAPCPAAARAPEAEKREHIITSNIHLQKHQDRRTDHFQQENHGCSLCQLQPKNY